MEKKVLPTFHYLVEKKLGWEGIRFSIPLFLMSLNSAALVCQIKKEKAAKKLNLKI